MTNGFEGAPEQVTNGFDRELFLSILQTNQKLTTILHRLPQLELPNWYLTGGALFQTVWNNLEGRSPEDAIKDYDVFYFDPTDVSYESEDERIKASEALFADTSASIEIRNEARVHLWYERKFGKPAKPFTSTEDAIDHFISPTCCYGVTLDDAGEMQVYAPHGYDDLFGGVVRPQDVLAPPDVYHRKTAGWKARWPSLRIIPWANPAR